MSTGVWAFVLAVVVMVGFAGMGVWLSRRRKVTLEGFVTARGSLGGTAAMATAVASVMGAWILFSPAEAATWAGLVGLIGYAVGQAAPLFAFMVIGPRMRRLMPNGHSLTEFIWFRYGRAMYALCLAIIIFYMFVFLAAEMGAIARAVRLVTDVPLLVTLVLVAGATLTYTMYGGLRASILTDNVQFALIPPLLIVVVVVVIVQLGGWGAAFDPVREANDALLSLSYQPGIEFGITLVIAILAANLFHQGFWQRVYACRTDRDVRTGFVWSGVVVIPMIVASGLFGLWAVGQGVLDPPTGAIALFNVVMAVVPGWAIVVLIVLGLVLVMSSMDTLLNGMVSVFTSDLPRLRPEVRGARLLASSRLITALLIVPAMAVGYAFDSVLYLFLIADLVCAGAVVPAFLGLYDRRLTGTAAAVSTVLGIAAGALFFPTKALAGWWSLPWLTGLWHILASGNLLASFLMAVLVSTVVAVLLSRFQRGAPYDFDGLGSHVSLLEDAS